MVSRLGILPRQGHCKPRPRVFAPSPFSPSPPLPCATSAQTNERLAPTRGQSVELLRTHRGYSSFLWNILGAPVVGRSRDPCCRTCLPGLGGVAPMLLGVVSHLNFSPPLSCMLGPFRPHTQISIHLPLLVQLRSWIEDLFFFCGLRRCVSAAWNYNWRYN